MMAIYKLSQRVKNMYMRELGGKERPEQIQEMT